MIRFILCGLLFSSLFTQLQGEPTVVPDPSRCLRELETHFFNEDLLYEALSLYKIPQGTWSPIYQELQRRSVEVPNRMKRKTAYMVPNPIEYPMNRLVTAQILKAVLFEVFIETLTYYQANEQPSATYAFDFIFSKRMPALKACLGDEVESLAPRFD